MSDFINLYYAKAKKLPCLGSDHHSADTEQSRCRLSIPNYVTSSGLECRQCQCFIFLRQGFSTWDKQTLSSVDRKGRLMEQQTDGGTHMLCVSTAATSGRCWISNIWLRASVVNLAPTGIRSPGHLVPSESQYRLRYPGPRLCYNLAAILGLHTLLTPWSTLCREHLKAHQLLRNSPHFMEPQFHYLLHDYL